MGKSFIIYLFIFFGLCSCNKDNQNYFTIEGKINGSIKDSTKIYLDYLTINNGIKVELSDTNFIINNKFYFKGNLNELTAGNLFTDDLYIPIYIEPKAMKIVIDMNNPYSYKLSGTSVEKENIELRNILHVNMNNHYKIAKNGEEIFEQINMHNNEQNTVDSLMREAIQMKEQLIVSAKNIDSLRLNFINKHKTYQIIPHLLFVISRNKLISNDKIENLYNSLPEHSKTTLLGKFAFEQIKQVKRYENKKDFSIGDMAPDFSRITMQGDTLKLTNFRKKSYILLDFWASWCGPCLKEIPVIKKIYNEINKEQFTIIGISLDHNEEDWQKAVNENQIGMWFQVVSDYTLDNNYFGNEKDLSEIYNVTAIPLCILIDKDGRIIDKWNHISKKQMKRIYNILQNL